ncbi:DnaJ domain-containing protein [Methanosphaera sp.]
MNYDEDYYALLGVDKNSDKQTIKKAYRRLAKQYHPDVNSDNNSEEKFKQITEAYHVLTDDIKRREYNQYKYGFNVTETLNITIDTDTIAKGVKFIIDLEKDYGLVSDVVELGLHNRKGRIKPSINRLLRKQSRRNRLRRRF